jgi:hypothetical protein
VNNIPGKHDIRELQKITMLGTAYMCHKILMDRYKAFVVGNNLPFTTYFNHRIAATLCIPFPA